MKSEYINCKSRNTAKRHAPWTAKIVKVEGGYYAFESITDYQTWSNQR